MPEPVVKLEIEFTTGVWTDVSSLLRNGYTKRGKSKSIDSPQPGFATFTMSNQSRLFDPDYAASISPGNILPDKKIRSEVTYNTVTYPLFTGQIDRIIQRYNGPNDSVAVLECSDGIAQLANTVLGSAWELEMGFQNPRAWYRLGETVGPNANERIAGNYGVYKGSPDFGTPGFAFDDDSLLSFVTSNDHLVLPEGAFRTDAIGPWQLSFLLNFPTGLLTGSQIAFLMRDILLPYGLSIWIDSSGFLNVRTWTPGETVPTYIRSGGPFGNVTSFPGSEDEGKLINIQFNTTSPYIRIFQFGNFSIEDVATQIGTGSKLTPSLTIVGANAYQWRIDEIATYNYFISSLDMGFMRNATAGYSVDDVFTRITRILDAVGWDPLKRDITTDWGMFLRATKLKETPIAHLARLAATAEHRTPFVERDGTLRIISRQEHASPPYTVSQATFGDGIGELPYVEMGDFTLDTETVENIVRRKWIDAEGREFIIAAEDAPSIAAGRRVRVGPEITSEWLTPDFEFNLAALRVAKLARLTPVVESLKILPRINPNSLFPQILGRELGDRVTWKRRPQDIGAPIERDVIIEGISHEFGPLTWETLFLIDPTDAFNYFHFDETQWDDDDWRFFF